MKWNENAMKWHTQGQNTESLKMKSASAWAVAFTSWVNVNASTEPVGDGRSDNPKLSVLVRCCSSMSLHNSFSAHSLQYWKTLSFRVSFNDDGGALSKLLLQNPKTCSAGQRACGCGGFWLSRWVASFSHYRTTQWALATCRWGCCHPGKTTQVMLGWDVSSQGRHSK